MATTNSEATRMTVTVNPDEVPTIPGATILPAGEAFSHHTFSHDVPLICVADLLVGDIVMSSHGYRLMVTKHSKPIGTEGYWLEGCLHGNPDREIRTQSHKITDMLPLLSRLDVPPTIDKPEMIMRYIKNGVEKTTCLYAENYAAVVRLSRYYAHLATENGWYGTQIQFTMTGVVKQFQTPWATPREHVVILDAVLSDPDFPNDESDPA